MKKVKISLVAAALIVSTGISLATSVNKPLETYCSTQPDGGGIVATPPQFGCLNPGPVVCCYRIPDNVVITRR